MPTVAELPASEIAALKLINTTSDARISELTATLERMLYGTRSERLKRQADGHSDASRRHREDQAVQLSGAVVIECSR